LCGAGNSRGLAARFNDKIAWTAYCVLDREDADGYAIQPVYGLPIPGYRVRWRVTGYTNIAPIER
jgi:hypothetical protein